MILFRVMIGLAAGAEEAGDGVFHENLPVMDDKRNGRWYTGLRNMKAEIIAVRLPARKKDNAGELPHNARGPLADEF